MNLRGYLWLMSIGTLLAWSGWILVLVNVDPDETGAVGLALFYLTLLMSLIGTLAIAGTLYRVLILKRLELPMRDVKVAFRHGFMLAFVAVIALALAAHGLLFWWNLLALFVFVGIIEYAFLLVQESRRH